ncbi:MAG TPA: phenylalanine--tRNA ligase subunit beta [Chthonomonadaceae bacterium]|nr:phenylalanine--tRNA ligase subunit beta [Chthonomonadaceae bacterium]
MRVPLAWLKEYCDVPSSAEDVATKLTMGGLEVEGNEPPDEVFEQAVKKQIPGDVARAAADLGRVLDVYVTPNRGDCLSMVGVAREVAALYGLPLRVPSPPYSTDGGAALHQTSVAIEDPDLCPRYAARLVRGVKIGPSPAWMQARLAAAGQRPINNVVDVTNYVMLELGQPLHAFDLDQLSGGRIVVRRARAGEKLTTLDGAERDLTPDMLVIADAERAVALAGLMGGADSEVHDGTTNLLLESAHFNPLSVRRTSRALGLRTEASYRFERVVDPDGVRRAVDRACELLAGMGQPAAVDGIIDVYPHPVPIRELSLRVARVHALLGMEVPSHAAADALRALGFDVHTEAHGKTDTLLVRVPSFRADVVQEEDLVEEVGRIFGYENIPETLPYANTTQGGDSAFGLFLARVRGSLVACGLQEVVTHSLTAPSFFDTPDDAAGRVAVRNALSAEISGLRRSLLPTLLDVAKHNAARGAQDLAIFEAGRIWSIGVGGSSADERTAGQSERDKGDRIPPVERDRPGERTAGQSQRDSRERAAPAGRERPDERVAIAGMLCGAVAERGWRHEPSPLIADFGAARGMVERLLHDLRIEAAAFVSPNQQPATSNQQPATSFQLPATAPHPGPGELATRNREPGTSYLHPGRSAVITLAGEPIGIVGEAHPRVAEDLGLRERIYLFELFAEPLQEAARLEGARYRPLSRYPAVVRDLAPRVSAGLPYAAVEQAARAAAPEFLESLRLTDVFEGAPLPPDTKSLTLSFTFRAADRTLGEAEVAAAMDGLRAALAEGCGATFA